MKILTLLLAIFNVFGLTTNNSSEKNVRAVNEVQLDNTVLTDGNLPDGGVNFG